MKASKTICPSCRSILYSPKHKARHRKYMVAHRRAALAYQKRKKAANFCTRCGRKKLRSTLLCSSCLMKKRIWGRAYAGCGMWHPGGMGRPAITLSG